MLFECMGIFVLSPGHESEIRGVCVGCKILISLILFKFSHSILNWTNLSRFFFFFWGGGFNICKGVCGPYHLKGLYSESALFYLL